MSGKARLSKMAVTFWCCVVAVPILPKLAPGIQCDTVYSGLIAGAVLGVAYLTARPILRLLTLPIGCLTLGLFGFVLDAGLIYLLSLYLPGFSVATPAWALIAALFIVGIQAIAGGLNRG